MLTQWWGPADQPSACPQSSWGPQKANAMGCAAWPQLTWLGALVHGAIVDLVDELGAVVIHVDDVDVQVDGVLHLVTVHVHGVGSELRATHTHQSQHRDRKSRKYDITVTLDIPGLPNCSQTPGADQPSL